MVGTPDTTLYRHYDEDNVLLYVGIALNTVARLAQHKDHAHWFARIRKVTAEPFPTRKAAVEAERAAILNEKPLYNVKHKRGEKPPFNYQREIVTKEDFLKYVEKAGGPDNLGSMLEVGKDWVYRRLTGVTRIVLVDELAIKKAFGE